jgi:hypothetical protein
MKFEISINRTLVVNAKGSINKRNSEAIAIIILTAENVASGFSTPKVVQDELECDKVAVTLYVPSSTVFMKVAL